MLTRIHISQMHPFGLMWLRRLEFCCQALGEAHLWRVFALFINSRFSEMVSYAVLKKAIGTEPPQSAHEWRMKFFWISKDVIPDSMEYRSLTDKFTNLTVADSLNQPWYNTLTQTPSPMGLIPESALVLVGMSRLWPFPDEVPYFSRDDGGILPLHLLFLTCSFFRGLYSYLCPHP